MTETIHQIELSKIYESPFNPRKHFNEDRLQELAGSIAAQGILQPLVVRAGANEKWELVLGERRFRAAKIAKLKTVPCVVVDFTDAAAREAQLVENAQREGITALEEAQAFADLQHLVPDTREIAARVGKSVRYVEVRIQLLTLAAPVKKALAEGKIEPSHAQELLPLLPLQQHKMLERLTSPNLYVRERVGTVKGLREAIAEEFKPKPQPSAAEKARRKKFEAEEKKRRAAYATHQKKGEAERALRAAVNERAVRALWPKLRDANAKGRGQVLGFLLEDLAKWEDGLHGAMLIAAGKPLPEGSYGAVNEAKFYALPAHEQIALLVLGRLIDWLDVGLPDSDPVLRWAKIDRQKIAAELKAAAAAQAKAAPVKAAQTSAPKGKGKPRGKGKTKKAKK